MSEHFSGLEDLLSERLDLSNQELDGLKDLNMRKRKRLQRLDLSVNRLTEGSLKEIASNKALTWLNVSSNLLEDFPILKHLMKLSVINASHNRIKTTKAFGSFKGLKALILNNNELQDTEGLEKLKDLNSLVLSHNYLRRIDVSHFHAITKLSLSHNAITDFPNLKSNPKLKEIRLNGNKIKQLSDTISYCRYLQLVDLGNNSIGSLSSIDSFKELSFLVNLNLKGNPVAKEEDYGAQIDKCCQHLKILDGQRRERFTAGAKAAPHPNDGNRKANQDTGSEHQLTKAMVSGKSSKQKKRSFKGGKKTKTSQKKGKEEGKLEGKTVTVKGCRQNQTGTETNVESRAGLLDRKVESTASILDSVLKPDMTYRGSQTCLTRDTIDSITLEEKGKHLDSSAANLSPQIDNTRFLGSSLAADVNVVSGNAVSEASLPDQVKKKKREKEKHGNEQKEQTGSCKTESKGKRDKRAQKRKAERLDPRAAVVALKNTKASKKQRPSDAIYRFLNSNDFGFGDGNSDGWA